MVTDAVKVRCPDCMGKGTMPVLLKGHDPKPCKCTDGTIEVFWQCSPKDSTRHLFQLDGQELLGLCGHRVSVSQTFDNVDALPCIGCVQVFNMLNTSGAISEANADESRWQGGFE